MMLGPGSRFSFLWKYILPYAVVPHLAVQVMLLGRRYLRDHLSHFVATKNYPFLQAHLITSFNVHRNKPVRRDE